MATSKRATIYFDAELHRRLRIRAAESERTISELAELGTRHYLDQMDEDLRLFDQRGGEPNLPLDTVLRELERRGGA